MITTRLRSEKRVEYLIGALPFLSTDYHLNIVGDGDQKSVLVQKVKDLDLSDRVTFFGNQSDLEKYYRHAACLVLCSEFEGLPNVAIEAICNGCPVVAYNINSALNSLDELIDPDNGIIKRYTSYSANSMAQLIEEAYINNYDRSTIEISAREKYSLETAIKKYTEILNKTDVVYV